eukprot:5871874-Amphidinium_carterae.1
MRCIALVGESLLDCGEFASSFLLNTMRCIARLVRDVARTRHPATASAASTGPKESDALQIWATPAQMQATRRAVFGKETPLSRSRSSSMPNALKQSMRCTKTVIHASHRVNGMNGPCQ